jgi:hypothetical protein
VGRLTGRGDGGGGERSAAITPPIYFGSLGSAWSPAAERHEKFIAAKATGTEPPRLRRRSVA